MTPARALVLLAALLVACVAGGAVADEPSASPNALEEGRAHVQAGRLEQAVEVFEKALAVADLDADRHAKLAAALGETLVRLGEPYAALKHLQAVAGTRGLATDHLALAEALVAVARDNAASGSGRWIEVVPYLNDAVTEAARAEEDDASLPRRLAVVGEARYWMGEPEAAAAAWDRLPVLDPATPERRRLRDMHARALYDLKRFGDSAVAFERADNPRGAASALTAAGKGREAIAVYARLLAETPGDEALLADAFAAARYAGVEADLAGALADLEVEGATRCAVLVTRGLLAEAVEAFDGAERLMEAAAAADPAAGRPLVELGRLRLLRAKGDDGLDAGVEALVAALHLAPDDERLVSMLWDVAGRDYNAAWRSARARARTLRIQRALTESRPDDELAWANLGNTLRVAGRLEESVAAYDRAMSIDASDPAIASDRGLALSALGRTDEALAAFEEAVRLDPDFDAARQNAARIHWLAGRDDEAAAHLAEAEVRTRSAGGNWMRYRFLQDRVYRTRIRPETR